MVLDHVLCRCNRSCDLHAADTQCRALPPKNSEAANLCITVNVSEPDKFDAALTKELLQKYDIKGSGSLVRPVEDFKRLPVLARLFPLLEGLTLCVRIR